MYNTDSILGFEGYVKFNITEIKKNEISLLQPTK